MRTIIREAMKKYLELPLFSIIREENEANGAGQTLGEFLEAQGVPVEDFASIHDYNTARAFAGGKKHVAKLSG